MSLKDKLTLLLLKPIIRKKARKSLPQLDGSLAVKGLLKPVKVLRDQWGVPHIYAESIDDLAFAQGYVHAQDRLWQMELNRRVGRGQLCEVAGRLALDTDRATKTLGFERLARVDYQELDADIKKHLHDYCNGINAYIDQNAKKLPVEFGLLKMKPRPWEPLDVVTFSRMLAWQMSYAWYGEIIRAKVIDKVGAEHAADLEVHYPKENPATLDLPGEVNIILEDGRLQAFKGPYLQPIKGSNAWTVAGSRSESGKPILCNDPHLPLSQPGIWYQNHLNGGDVHVSGVSLPGTPMVMIGHNANIAWGMTLAFTDIQDTFIEKFTDDTCTHYHFKGEVKASTIVEEVIKIKDEADFVERVVITHHGPIISNITGPDNMKLSLSSNALKKSGMLYGWYNLNRASNWDEFVGSMKHINAPALNVPYADVHGNIGYWNTGQVPIRSNSKGNVPTDGSTGNSEWVGNVPFEEMPHAFNPAKGYIATCNHKIINDDFPHYMGNDWMNGYRAKRLDELFAQKEKFNLTDMRNMQVDVYNVPGPKFAHHFKGLNLANETPLLQQMNELLITWDGVLDEATIGGCIFQALRHCMLEVILDPKLGSELTRQIRGLTYNDTIMPQYEFYGYDTVTLLRLLDDENNWWVKEAGGKQAILMETLKRAADYLTQCLGKDINQWQWGKLHKVEFHHIIGGKKPLNKIFNQGPFSIPGDTNTLYQTANMAHDPLGNHIVAPSYRQVIDLGNLGNSRSIIPQGQSGNICSPYYADQLPLYLAGEYHPMYWLQQDVAANSKHNLVLQPE